MAKKAATNPAPVASENVSEEVVTSTVPETSATPETEATTSPAIDQPAVTDDASASSPSSDPVSDPAPKDEASEEEAAPASSSPAEPVVEHKGGGGSFESPFAEPKPALTMIERIELLEKRVAELEAK